MRLVHLAAAFALCCAPAAFAQRTGQLRGTGVNAICNQYTEARKTGNQAVDMAVSEWVFGFLSGYAVFSSHPQITVPDQAVVLSYLDKFCRDNPRASLHQGAIELIGSLGGWQRPGKPTQQ